VSRIRRRVLNHVAALVTLLLVGNVIASGKVQRVQLKIEAGTAPAALAEFIRQTGMQVLFRSDALRDCTTHAVSGQYGAAEALALMLDGTGLVFEFVNDRTITVRPRIVTRTASEEALFHRAP
jgi:hypothetical protein